jgi:hypothetical protein
MDEGKGRPLAVLFCSSFAVVIAGLERCGFGRGSGPAGGGRFSLDQGILP